MGPCVPEAPGTQWSRVFIYETNNITGHGASFQTESGEEIAGDIEGGKEIIYVPYAERTLEGQKHIQKVLLELLKSWISSQFPLNFQSLAVFIMNTDNMEPSIRKNELMLIDKSQNKIESSGVYALNVNGKVVIRRYIFREDAFVDSIQDNRAYPSERKTAAEMKNLQVLGKVVKVVKDI